MKSFKFDPKFDYYLAAQRHECRAKRQKIKNYNARDLYKELYKTFTLFENHLPKNLNNILDVGCGLGYIDVIISHQISGLNYFMFDTMFSEYSKVKYFYNDLTLTKEFLILNGIPKENINLIDASKTGNSQTENNDPGALSNLPIMDLVISQFAWGWHSRIIKYIKEVSAITKPGSLLVLDVKGKLDTDTHQDNITLINQFGFKLLDAIVTDENKYLLIAKRI